MISTTWMTRGGFAAVMAALSLIFAGVPAGAQESGAGGTAASQDDRYIGYYYPAPQSEEQYGPRVETMPGADRRRRVAFVTGLSNELMRGGNPPFSIFAKGGESRHLILIGLDDDGFATLYRMRAWLAALTAFARSTPAFNNLEAPPETLTFLDLLRMLGFEDVVISDGRTIAHRITLL